MLTQTFIRACVTMIITFFALSTTVQAVETSQYAGQQNRSIKSLSDEDIHSLKTGQGWGLAKPAELNGVPGPAHIIELKEELQLSDKQLASIQALWETMNRSAKHYGELYLQSEKNIEHFFQSTTTIEEQQLSSLLAESANHLAKLRYVHLQAHLKAKPLLTKHQLMMYQRLRGYRVVGNHGEHKH